MKEILFYSVLACCSLFIFGYAIHMLVGGLVSWATEVVLITAACVIAAGVMGFMAWDVIRQRRKQSGD